MSFKKIKAEDFSEIFDKVGKDWMLIGAGGKGEENAMTASWGCFGILWNKPVCVCFIRPQRHTHGLVEKCDRLSLTFFDESYRETLKYFGARSGADTNKIADRSLTVLREGDVPYFAEAHTVLICKKLYVGKLEESGFLDKSLLDHYSLKDYHSVYVCEIEGVLKK